MEGTKEINFFNSANFFFPNSHIAYNTIDTSYTVASPRIK
jgi:hypothetical protein